LRDSGGPCQDKKKRREEEKKNKKDQAEKEQASDKRNQQVKTQASGKDQNIRMTVLIPYFMISTSEDLASHCPRRPPNSKTKKGR
jgi:hypothetical protein